MGLLLTASLRAEGSKNPKIFLKDLLSNKFENAGILAQVQRVFPAHVGGYFATAPCPNPSF